MILNITLFLALSSSVVSFPSKTCNAISLWFTESFEKILHLQAMSPKIDTHTNTFGQKYYIAVITDIARRLIIITLLKIVTFIPVRSIFFSITFQTAVLLLIYFFTFSFDLPNMDFLIFFFLFHFVSPISIMQELPSGILQSYTFSGYYFTAC